MATLAPAAPLLAGGPPGWIAFGVIAVGTLGLGAYAYMNAREQSSSLADATTDKACKDCPCHRTVTISKTAHPQSAQHILDAQKAGHPSTLTIDRPGATARRRANIGSYPREPGKQPDEYPPAMFAEGGPGSSIRNIDAADNMGAGASMGNQLRGAPEGCKATIVVGP